MSVTSTAQAIINWSRQYIPDPKTRVHVATNELLGRTALPTNQRETFYIKHCALGSVSIYVDPYLYSSVASIGAAATYSKVFMYNATLQSCIFASTGERPIRPAQFREVRAQYQYTEGLPYAYTDDELEAYLMTALSYLNNTFEFSYTYTGMIGTDFVPVYTTDQEKELIAKGLAIIVRKSYVDEQKKRGFGIRFRGPNMTIDSVQQMKDYADATNRLVEDIRRTVASNKLGNAIGQTIELYEENTVG